MAGNWLHCLGKLSLAIPLAVNAVTIGSVSGVVAQIVPDNSLGSENSVVTPINSQLERIDGGAIRGANLFHSFREFNIGEGRGAYFANPTGIGAIFSRVTGSNPSHIFGTLGVLGEANLFLINPHGILFGPNAQLNMRGSFVASTANSFVFSDGSQFSATSPNAPPLLTVDVSVPVGLQFVGEPGAVVNTGDLAVASGENLTLVGGTVVSTGELSAPGGEVALLAVPEVMADGGKPLVELTEGGQLLGLSSIANLQSSVSAAQTLSELLTGAGNLTELKVNDNGEVQLTETDTRIPTDAGVAIASGKIDVSGDTAGKVQVLGDKVGLFDAQINANGTNSGGTVLIGGDYQGVGPILNADRTYISSDSVIKVDALENGDGGRAIAWADGTTGFYGKISARGGSNSGNGGYVEVSGKENLIFRGEVDTSAPHGNFGTLLLDPEDIIIVDGVGVDDGELADGEILSTDSPGATFTISSRTLGALTGNVLLEASNDIVITPGVSLDFARGDGAIAFTADADMNGIGAFVMDAGDTINTNGRDISIRGASITTGSIDSTLKFGIFPVAAGDISLTSSNGDISTTDLITSDVPNGGDVSLLANGNITTLNIDADGLDNGGIILLQAGGNITTRNVDSEGGFGNGGKIELIANGNITTHDVESNSIFRNGGTIELTANGNITTLNVDSEGVFGDGGKIELTANGNITTRHVGADGLINGGIIMLQANGNITTRNVDSESLVGDGGTIELTANGNITTRNVESDSVVGNGGVIKLTSHNGKIDTTGGTLNSGSVTGNGGAVTLAADDNIVTGDTISASGGGNGGKISFNSNRGAIDTTGSTLISASDAGNAGEIALTADSNITIQDIQSVSNSGNGGGITLTSHNGAINTIGEIVNSGSVSRNGGDIAFTANRNIKIEGIINSNGNLAGGDITLQSTNGAINAEQFLLNSGGLRKTEIRSLNDNGVELPAEVSASNNVNAGAIKLSASDGINISAGVINASSSPDGLGVGGSITFTSSDGAISLENNVIRSVTYVGMGGDINFNAKSVSLTNSNAIVRTRNDAKAGNIKITATEFVDLNQGSILATQNQGTKPNGNLTIDTQALRVRDGSILSTSTQSTSPTGSGGILTVNADSVEISGTSPDGLAPSALASISLRLGDTAANGGEVRINANQLTIQDGGSVLGSTVGKGKGGNVVIKADSVIVKGTSENQLFGSSLSVEALGDGKAGNLTIEANRLSVEDGGVISASTFSKGNAGNITIKAGEVFVSGASLDNQIKSGIYAQSFDEGKAGSIDIVTGDLIVQNGARINVNSEPRSKDSGNLINKTNAWLEALKTVPRAELDGIPPDFAVARGSGTSDAGNITIDANNIFLNNQGQITAVTSSGEGGNIRIDVWDLILMRHNSEISTTAGTAPGGGNGGNIIINAPFIIAVPTEDSDITANAFTGNGGRITIFSQAIFGLKFRPNRTHLSDITVTSTGGGIDGIFELNTLGIDPSRGLISLPNEPVNTEIDEGCQGNGGLAKVEFFEIGYAGLPFSPDEPFDPDFDELVSEMPEVEQESNRIVPQSYRCSLNP
ncbi:MAG: filamentous hemagglutinin N-terminal domain-containing protein [Symploca sp. SIO2C1]|nr:filamentous hemagglutinin N-terminal domain-containing protein [Symploca sp. SIO2C1]